MSFKDDADRERLRGLQTQQSAEAVRNTTARREEQLLPELRQYLDSVGHEVVAYLQSAGIAPTPVGKVLDPLPWSRTDRFRASGHAWGFSELGWAESLCVDADARWTLRRAGAVRKHSTAGKPVSPDRNGFGELIHLTLSDDAVDFFRLFTGAGVPEASLTARTASTQGRSTMYRFDSTVRLTMKEIDDHYDNPAVDFRDWLAAKAGRMAQ